MKEKKEIYLDCAATTKPSASCIKDINYILENHWYNESSVYERGRESKRIIEHAKKQIADFLNCEPDEIYFTSSGSQSNNWAINMAIENRQRIYYSPVEHPSIYNKIVKTDFKDTDLIHPFKEIPIDEYGKTFNNVLDYHLYEDKRFKITPFVTVMTVNNETGVINNIQEIGEIVKGNGGYFHTDATQAIGHIPIDVKKQNISLLTFSAHKLHVPKGIGVLYVSHDYPIRPFIIGGHQQDGLFAGTMPIHLIYALGNMIKQISLTNFATKKEREDDLRLKMIKAIDSACKDSDVSYHIIGEGTETMPTILSVSFKGYDNQQLMTMLEELNVYCSTGSACSSGDNTPSRVLTSMEYEDATSTLRFSFDTDLTPTDIVDFKYRLMKALIMLEK